MRDAYNITIYGQDHTSISKAYISLFKGNDQLGNPIKMEDLSTCLKIITKIRDSLDNKQKYLLSKEYLDIFEKQIYDKYVLPRIKIERASKKVEKNKYNTLDSIEAKETVDSVLEAINIVEENALKKDADVLKIMKGEIEQTVKEKNKIKIKVQDLKMQKNKNGVLNQVEKIYNKNFVFKFDDSILKNYDMASIIEIVEEKDDNKQIISILTGFSKYIFILRELMEGDYKYDEEVFWEKQYEIINDINKNYVRFITDYVKKLNTSLHNENEDSRVIICKLEESSEDDMSFLDKSNDSFKNIVGTISSNTDYKVGDLFETRNVQMIINKAPVTSVKLEIYSRFDDFDNLVINNKPPFFLLSMLSKSDYLKPAGGGYESSFDWNSLFDFFMIIIIKNVLEQALAKGYFKKYHKFEINSEKVKGSIDIARHIRLNAGLDNNKIACTYRENTQDNMVNHLLFEAFEYLDDKYTDIISNNIDDDLLRNLKKLKYDIGYPKYSRNTIISKNTIPISHPYYNEYRDIQKYCLMVLRDEGVSPFGNSETSVEGILFYVNDLWEEYLEGYMKQSLNEYNEQVCSGELDSSDYYEIKVYTQRKLSKMVASYEKHIDDFDHKEEKTELRNESRPDYVFAYKDGSNDRYIAYSILDAKYRKWWNNALSGELNNDILGEDYNKCLRDMVTTNSMMSAGIIFPITKKEFDNNSQIVHKFSKYNRDGRFYTFPIVVPDARNIDTMDDWVKQFEPCVEQAISIIKIAMVKEVFKARLYNKVLEDVRSSVVEINNDINVEIKERIAEIINSDCCTDYNDV